MFCHSLVSVTHWFISRYDTVYAWHYDMYGGHLTLFDQFYGAFVSYTAAYHLHFNHIQLSYWKAYSMWLKFICALIAVFSTSLFVSNLVTDFTAAMTWREMVLGGKEIKDNSKAFAKFRMLLSVIMGLSWGGVLCL